MAVRLLTEWGTAAYTALNQHRKGDDTAASLEHVNEEACRARNRMRAGWKCRQRPPSKSPVCMESRGAGNVASAKRIS